MNGANLVRPSCSKANMREQLSLLSSIGLPPRRPHALCLPISQSPSILKPLASLQQLNRSGIEPGTGLMRVSDKLQLCLDEELPLPLSPVSIVTTIMQGAIRSWRPHRAGVWEESITNASLSLRSHAGGQGATLKKR